jgi:UDP-2-acetamido-3-amino-2,3-dideoxy-glucuronate N-acetyltransferase
MPPNIFIHPTAICHCKSLGSGTRIWAFCNVQDGSVIGSDVNIGDHCYIEENVVIGDRVTVKNGVSLWDGVTVEDDVFIGPHAVFTNDVFPRSKVRHDHFDKTLLRRGATIGANATIVAGHTIGRYAFIGAGAVVTKNIPDFTLWLGNPAGMAGYVCHCARRLSIPDDLVAHGALNETYRAVCACGAQYALRGKDLSPIGEGGEA